MDGNIGIQIGASPEAVREARGGVEAILRSDRDEETVRVALRVFLKICDVTGALVTNTTITMPSAITAPDLEEAGS
jgi:hypothetical protein